MVQTRKITFNFSIYLIFHSKMTNKCLFLKEMFSCSIFSDFVLVQKEKTYSCGIPILNLQNQTQKMHLLTHLLGEPIALFQKNYFLDLKLPKVSNSSICKFQHSYILVNKLAPRDYSLKEIFIISSLAFGSDGSSRHYGRCFYDLIIFFHPFLQVFPFSSQLDNIACNL